MFDIAVTIFFFLYYYIPFAQVESGSGKTIVGDMKSQMMSRYNPLQHSASAHSYVGGASSEAAGGRTHSPLSHPR